MAALRYAMALCLSFLATCLHASPLDPSTFPSLGPNPFTVPGTYTILSVNPPLLEGPTGTFVGANSPDNLVAVFAFSSIAVGPGMQIEVAGPRPVALLSHTTLLLQGTIAASAFEQFGGPGGAAGRSGSGLGPGGGMAAPPNTGYGGGGGGHGAAGGKGGGELGGAGGVVNGNLLLSLQGGSAGGASGGGTPGGGGGGAVEFGAVMSMTVEGTIVAEGGLGRGGSGGGSGGAVLLHAPTVTLGGVIGVRGGSGTTLTYGGGGGGAGRVLALTNADGLTVSPSFVLFATGGFGGSPLGQNGGSTALETGTLPPPPPASAGLTACIDSGGAPIAGATVKLRQKSSHQSAVTGSDGCFTIETVVSGREGTLVIDLPALP